MADVARLVIRVSSDADRAVRSLAQLDAQLRRVGSSGDGAVGGLNRVGNAVNTNSGHFARGRNIISRFIFGMGSLGASLGQGAAQLAGWGAQGVSVMGTVGQLAGSVAALAAIMAVAGAAISLIGSLMVGLGAIVGALLPIAFIALGAAALAGTAEVSAAFNSMGNSVIESIQRAAAPLKGPLIEGMKQITSIAKQLEPALKAAFTGVGPLIQPLVKGIGDLAKNAMPGFNAAISAAGPLMQGFATFLGSIGTGLGQFFEKMMGSKEAVNGLKTALETLGQGIQLVMTTLGEAIGQMAKDPTIIENLGLAFQALADAIKLCTQIAIAFAPVLKIMLTVFMALMSVISGFVAQMVMGFNAIKTAVTTAWDAIVMATTTAWNAVRTAVTTAWNAIKTAITTAVAVIAAIVTAAWNMIKTITTTVWNAIKTAVTTAWNAIKTAVTTAVNAIKTVVTTAWNAIKQVVTTVMNAIKTAVTTAWNAIKTAVTTAMNAIKSAVKAAWEAIKSAVKSAMDGIKSAVTAGMNAVKAAIKAGITAAVNLVKGAVGMFKSAGAAIMKGLASGIASGGGAVLGAAKSVLGKLRSLLPFSPAKTGPFSGKGWTLYSGMSIMEALGDGMLKKSGMAQSALSTTLGGMNASLTANSVTTGGGGAGVVAAGGGTVININLDGAIFTGGHQQVEDVVVRAVQNAQRNGRLNK